MTVPMQKMNDYWFDHYEKGEFPAEQFGILSWTTRSDPSLAPAGHHIIAVTLAPGPYRLAGTTWDKEKETIKQNVIQYLESRYLPGLRDHIVHADFSTPVDFEKRLLSPEGAIYALRQDLTNAMMFRPSAKSKQIKGLYLVGASTHPGGGVPTVTASAHDRRRSHRQIRILKESLHESHHYHRRHFLLPVSPVCNFFEITKAVPEKSAFPGKVPDPPLLHINGGSCIGVCLRIICEFHLPQEVIEFPSQLE